MGINKLFWVQTDLCYCCSADNESNCSMHIANILLGKFIHVKGITNVGYNETSIPHFGRSQMICY